MDDAGHFPVMRQEVLALLAPAGKRTIVDCTVGLGGHAEALLEAAGPQAVLIGVDLDPRNLLKTKERLARFEGRFRLFEANFADVDEVLREAGVASADAVLADLGVCSVHLDEPGRGFSFQSDGPLDMRMGAAGPSAADLVNRWNEAELAEVIWRYGEERFSRRIARAIVEARRHGRIERTGQLAEIVWRALGGRRGRRIHPATRTFQAIRIAVNRELENLQHLVEKSLQFLSVGGRVAIISYHSLEDRVVKQQFIAAARTGKYRLVTKKPHRPDATEVGENPRSRSARLRAIERIW